MKTIAVLNQHATIEALIDELQMAGYRIQNYVDEGSLLAHIDTDQVDMVIMDIKYADEVMESVYKRLKDKHPSVIRVALSQLSDSKQVFKTIESNLARLFLYKSWDTVSVVTAIQKLFNLEDQLQDPGLIAFINSINNLPTVPSIYQQVSQLVDEDVEVEKIAEIIERDPSISSSILRVANSAFYGARTGSIAQAIMFIGLGNVKNIILGHSIFMADSGHGKMAMFWEHAVLSNRISHILYEYFHQRKMPLVNSSAGLLHNVGQLLMYRKFGDAYASLLDDSSKEPEDHIIEKEMERFKIDHATIGAYLLNWWELPLNIVEVAMSHHSPKEENIKNQDITSIVHLSSQCAWYLIFNENLNLLPREETLLAFGLSQQRLREIITQRVKR